jgi:hypothetical protein
VIMTHLHKFVKKRRFIHEEICPKELFDVRSFRRVRTDGHLVTVACPLGKYNAKLERCKVGTRSQNLLHPVREFSKRYPRKMKVVEKAGRKGVMLPSSTVRKYCPT